MELADFNNYILKAKERGNENSGIMGVLNGVKWIVKNLQEQGMIDNKIDLNKIAKLKNPKKDVIYLTKEEITKFLGVVQADIDSSFAIRNMRAMTLYVFLLETGARISEALSVKINDIDFENKEIPIIGKGNKPRTLFLQSKSLEWINRYLQIRKSNNEYLFVTLDGKSAWSDNDVNRSFLRYRKLTNLNKRFTIHTLRHTFATQLLHNGVPINQVSFLLGHANLETTMKYYIGTIKKAEAKQYMKDEYFNFVS